MGREGARRWTGHDCFPGALVRGEDAAEAGEDGEGVAEVEGVDEEGRGDGDFDVGEEGAVGEEGGGDAVEVEDGEVGADGGRGLCEGQGELVDVGDDVGDGFAGAGVGVGVDFYEDAPSAEETGVEVEDG